MHLIIVIILISYVSATIPSFYQAQLVVGTHNFYRHVVDPPAIYMADMIWNSSLANNSNNWVIQCNWDSNIKNQYNIGKNIYATTFRDKYFSPNIAANSWGMEKPDYTYYTNTCATNKFCADYTQMIWNISINIGCAYQDCPIINGLDWPNGGTIVMCQYFPPGNTKGDKPYISIYTHSN